MCDSVFEQIIAGKWTANMLFYNWAVSVISTRYRLGWIKPRKKIPRMFNTGFIQVRNFIPVYEVGP